MENNIQKPIIGIISPCYNEQEVLPESGKQFNELIIRLINKGLISDSSFVAFIDDGSKDNTWQIIQNLANQHKHLKGLKMAGNVGQYKATLGGLMSFKIDADALVTVDCDLQDDLNVIEEMILKFIDGVQVVYGVRKQRTTDSWFKRRSALAFYAVMKQLKIKSIYNHAEFRLVGRIVLDALEQYTESNLYLRAIFPIIGYKQDIVYYDRMERFAGETKYPLMKLISVAWEGISSFSSAPLRIISVLGILVFLGSLGLTVYAIISYFAGYAVKGWFSIVLPIYFLGGVQLLCLGVIGEYIGKIYTEIKGRPRFLIEKRVD